MMSYLWAISVGFYLGVFFEMMHAENHCPHCNRKLPDANLPKETK